MKKLLMTVAVLAVASIVTAQTVTSANVVGYAKEATPAAGGFQIVSMGILADGDTVDIQDAIANVGDLNGAGLNQFANADKIYVWSGTGYTTYGLWDDGTDRFWMTEGTGWTKSGAAAPSSGAISRGQAVWYETGAGGTAADLMTAGEVPDDGTYNFAVADFTLLAYPYAATINLQDLVVSNAAGAALGQFANADKIYVWSGTGYSTYGLWDDGTDSFWMSEGTGWTKAGAAAPADADLDLGKGVWYESATGAKTIGFTQNYNLD